MPSATAHIAGVAISAAALLCTARASAYGPETYPTARAAAGVAIHVGPEPSPKPYLAIDVTGGIDLYTQGLGDKGGFVLTLEGGYSHDAAGPLHAATLVSGLAYGNRIAGVRYKGMLLAGARNGDPAVGVRNSVIGFFFMDTFTIEAGQQLVYSNDQVHHDLRVLVGLNPASFIFDLLERENQPVIYE